MIDNLLKKPIDRRKALALGGAAVSLTALAGLYTFSDPLKHLIFGNFIHNVKEEIYNGRPDLPREAREADIALIMFSTTWCGGCPAVKRELETLVKQHPNVYFGIVDVTDEKNQGLDDRFGIYAVPTVLYLDLEQYHKNGQPVATAMGITEFKEKILPFFEKKV